MASLDEVAASLKNPEELPLKPLSNDEVMAMIKSRLRSEDMATLAPSDSRNYLPALRHNNE